MTDYVSLDDIMERSGIPPDEFQATLQKIVDDNDFGPETDCWKALAALKAQLIHKGHLDSKLH